MRKRRQQVPQLPITAYVEKFSHDGRGIARIEGKTTFIDGALANETITFQYTRKKSDFDEGRLLSIIEPSPLRVDPLCPHYVLCGGCSLQHLAADAQIDVKQSLLEDALLRIGHVQPEAMLLPLKCEPWHYRNKARLSVRYVEKKQAALVGFREKNNPRYITEINGCLVLHRRVDAAIPALRALIDGLDDPHAIAQIEVAAGDDDVALIFRNLSILSLADEEKLKQFAQSMNFRIFLQPGGAESVYLFYPESASQFLQYTLPAHAITFQFHPTDFTQVNAGLNRLMIDQVLQLLALEENDVVLDLFCGLGNFSLPMAKYCARVVGVEGSEQMVKRARMNASENGLTHVEFYCANLDDETVLPQFAQYSASKMLLDPPRTGALSIVKQMDKLNPQRLVYVSCNPTTLARDADILVNQHGYRLLTAGVMDMFPHTSHVESVALFVK